MSARTIRRVAAPTAALTLALSVGLGALTPSAIAAPTVSSTGTPSYTEQAAPVQIGQNLSITGGGSYGGRYIDFEVGSAQSTETLSVLMVATPVVTAGVVSVVGGTVYLGNGTAADPIGSVDSTSDGQAGRKLRINFTNTFDNSGFETSLDGWTAVESRVDLGTTVIAGRQSQDTSTYPGNTPGGNDSGALTRPGTYTVRTTTSGQPTEGTLALELASSGIQTAAGYGVVHGPAIYSSDFQAAAGDTLYFDWRAFAGDDAYHVFGYLLDEQGNQTEVIDATTNDYTGSTAWATSTTTVPRTGTYKFVFVGGTYDATGGRAAGARLLIDNIKVFGTRASDPIVEQLATKLTYANSSDAPATSRTVTVSASSSTGIGTGTIPVTVTPVDDAPSLSGAPDARFTNNLGDDTFAPVTGTLAGTDPDGDVITYGIAGGTALAATVDGVGYTHQVTGAYGTLHVDAASGAWVVVPDDAAIEPVSAGTSEAFTVTATASGVTVNQPLTLTIEVPPSAPGAPTGLTASGGDTTAALSWVAPVWSGGSPATGHVVEQSDDGGDTWTVASATASSDTTWTVTGLINGTPYLFRVAATNSTARGASSAPAAATPFTVPGAPTMTSVVGTNRTLVVSVTEPAEDGGSPVTGYQYSVDGGTTWSGTVQAQDGTVSVHGLDNSRTYPVVLRAVNAAGPGAPSTPLPGITVREPVPSDVTPASGPVVVTVDDAEGDVDVEAGPDGIGVVGESFELVLAGEDADGDTLDSSDGVLVLEEDGTLRVSGSGYAPGSVLDVWILEGTVFLGEVQVGDDGTFDQALSLRGVQPGEYTVQVNGLGADGSNLRTTMQAEVLAESILPGLPGLPGLPTLPTLPTLPAKPAAVVSTVARATNTPVTQAAARLATTGGGLVAPLSAGLVLMVVGGALVVRRRTEATEA